MIKADPIIAVADVEKSAAWYQTLLGCKNIHEGDEFDVLVDDRNEVILNLHKWSVHEHPSMKDKTIPNGNGLILYLRTDQLDRIYQKAIAMGCILEKEIHVSTNSHQREFALKDLDGYHLIISEYHNYGG